MNNILVTVNFTEIVTEGIHKVEERMQKQTEGHHPKLVEALKYLLSSGGKRIRPTITLLIGGMYQTKPEKLITLGAAVEMLHTATLVHDDLIDGSLLRRGIATLNSKWSSSATVLTGDFFFAGAAELAAETESVDVMKLFSRTLATIVSGEVTQMFSKSLNSTREDYFNRIYSKTASLFEAAAGASAMMSDVRNDNMEIVKKVSGFGKNVGLAFQIVDDVLDFTGEQTKMGKPVANDLRQGLITLPTLHYFEDHPQDPNVLNYLNHRKVSPEDLELLIEEICNSGAVDKSMRDSKKYIKKAQDFLLGHPASPERQALMDLTNHIINRHS